MGQGDIDMTIPRHDKRPLPRWHPKDAKEVSRSLHVMQRSRLCRYLYKGLANIALSMQLPKAAYSGSIFTIPICFELLPT